MLLSIHVAAFDRGLMNVVRLLPYDRFRFDEMRVVFRYDVAVKSKAGFPLLKPPAIHYDVHQFRNRVSRIRDQDHTSGLN